MTAENGPTPEEMGIVPSQEPPYDEHEAAAIEAPLQPSKTAVNSIVEHSNFVRLEDVKQATDYAKKEIPPEEYYAARWNETIKLSDELSEEEKIQWTRPQLILMGGLPRSGKSTVATTLEREFAKEGIPCVYFGSDEIRNKIKGEIEQQLLLDGYKIGTDDFANERESRLYSSENRQRVYDMLYTAAGEFMREGKGIVIVDATHITADKRANAYEAIMSSYKGQEEDQGQGEGLAEKPPEFNYIEVSNSLQQALDIFEKDNERIAQTRKGLMTEEQDRVKLQRPAYLPFDVSEAHPGIRRRDEALYEPITTKHIKVINAYSTPDELISHVRASLLAKKPEMIDKLMDIEEE